MIVRAVKRCFAIVEQQWSELAKCQLVDLFLEGDHLVHRVPIGDPSPRIKLRAIAAIKADLIVTGLHLEHEPDLFLTDTDGLVAAPDIALGESIMEPVLGATKNLDGARPEPDLFVEFAVHRLFRGLFRTYATLRKLPGVVISPSRPEQATAFIAQDYADVGPVSVTIDHVQINQLIAIYPILTQRL